MAKRFTKALPDMKALIKSNPRQAAFYAICSVVIALPAAATTPAFMALGLGAKGPVAGLSFAKVMSSWGFLKAGGFWATIQSAAMGGYGVGVVAGITKLFAFVIGLTGFLLGRRGKMWRK
ncbi:hypothetical protein P154DRAFT_624927 [Amniculicola lignicola CBS 123094]|uniref:Uncharacterized protein n=1 Tax=Amniculicola lignicola CBS 123094 TaxID=1392246 RepID=A0A6A5VXQ8_9PLEO|nr:hypothetical protein P154DRAFT_624927 [Amniculicola lignicola CBS 123094]